MKPKKPWKSNLDFSNRLLALVQGKQGKYLMRINEVQQPSDQTLFESIDAENKTGYLTEDLVKVVRAAQSDQWSIPMTAEELLASLK